MPKVRAYVDGFNLYHAIDALAKPELKWINLRKLAISYLHKDDTLDDVKFFTAILTWNPEKQARHKNYIAAQIASGVTVVESNFKKATRHCKMMDRYCPRYEEKQTDVAIATSMLADALIGGVDRMILVTADSDQIPTIKTIKQLAPNVKIVLATPPGRETSARELGSVVHDRRPITAGRLLTCKLPRDVHDKEGKKVATIPALYLRG